MTSPDSPAKAAPGADDVPASGRGVARARPLKQLRDMLESKELQKLERWNVEFVRRTFEDPRLDRVVRGLQRHVGANWIEWSIRNLRNVYHEDRVGPLDPNKSYAVVANHRSFFDLYCVTAYLVKRGMPHRLMFPVRSQFFYDHPLGFVVNGAMSFYAMYPPVFRDPKRAALNLSSLDEVARVLREPGFFVGLHPEGMRNKNADPYELLPAQSGIGRILHASGATVIPVFVNGLGNDIVKQVGSNYLRPFTGVGEDVNVVFGKPIDFGELADKPSSPRVNKRVAEICCEHIAALGEEERAIRAGNRPAGAASKAP